MEIAHNKANDFWRERSRRPPHQPLDQQGPPIEDDSLAEREFVEHIVRAAFVRLQGEFDARTVTACRECWLNGRPVAEVAAELELTTNAVGLRLTRARKRLAELLRGMLD
jgi:DNA-directed RNA polymerase specialized sigma24 family protein